MPRRYSIAGLTEKEARKLKASVTRREAYRMSEAHNKKLTEKQEFMKAYLRKQRRKEMQEAGAKVRFEYPLPRYKRPNILWSQT